MGGQEPMCGVFWEQEDRNLGPSGDLLGRRLLEESLLTWVLASLCQRASQDSHRRGSRHIDEKVGLGDASGGRQLDDRHGEVSGGHADRKPDSVGGPIEAMHPPLLRL